MKEYKENFVKIFTYKKVEDIAFVDFSLVLLYNIYINKGEKYLWHQII